MLFLTMALPNILGLFILSGDVKKELEESFVELKTVLENYNKSLKKKPIAENVSEKKDGAKKQMGLF